MTARDFLSSDDLTPDEQTRVLDVAAELKAARAQRDDLAGKTVAMIFEKPSTRTRVSFEVAIAELGGHALPLSAAELQLGRGETIEDTGRVLERYVQGLVVRTFEQERLTRLASAAGVPVINALSDLEHPCQALADLLTIREKTQRLAGVRLTYVGDGNNVAHSLLLAGALAGMHVVVACPPGYEPAPDILKRAQELGSGTGGSARVSHDPMDAVRDAGALYTDVWASMGQEAQAAERRRVFAPYQLNAALLAAAAPGAIVLHCLPAHRGEEISDEVIDGPASVVWDQAENRLHTQKAVLQWLVGGRTL